MIGIKILDFIRRGHKIFAAAYSHTGNIREINQDNLYINGEYMDEKEIEKPYFNMQRVPGNGVSVFAVSDGMGGESYGEQSSFIAVSELKNAHDKFGGGIERWDKTVSEYITTVNNLICDIMKKHKCSSGTTLAMLCTNGKYAKIYNVGDSRAYMLRGKKLSLLTQDHTLVQQLINSGCLSVIEAKTHPGRHKLIQNLGMFPKEGQIVPYIHPVVELQTGDIFLLCSDGVTDMCGDAEIKEILMKENGIASMGKKLLEQSLEKGGRDNITMILLSVE